MFFSHCTILTTSGVPQKFAVMEGDRIWLKRQILGSQIFGAENGENYLFE